MKNSFQPVVVLLVSIFALALFASSRANAAGGSSSKKGSASTTYLVVKIIDESKDEKKNGKKIEYKAIPSTQFKDEQKKLMDDYAKRMDEWKDLKKTDPTAPAPVKPTIKKIGTPYKTQTVAQETAKKLQDEEEGKVDPKVKDTRK